MKSSLQPLYYLGAAPLLQLLAVIFLQVAMVTTYWMKSDSAQEHFGLFQICVSTSCEHIDRHTRITDTFRPIVSTVDLRPVCFTEECVSWVAVVDSVRFLMAASLASALFALVISCYYAFRAITSRSISLGYVIVTLFCSIVAIIMSSVSCDVYTREVYHVTRDANSLNHKVGYSLILAGTGGVLSLAGGLVAMVSGLKMRHKLPDNDHLIHAPPGGRHNGKNAHDRHGDASGHVSWVERGSRPPSLPAPGRKVGPLPPLRGKGSMTQHEKSKLPPLPENRSDTGDY